MNVIMANFDKRSYPIYVGDDVINSADIFQRHVHGRQIMLVSNETVAPMYLDNIVRHYVDHIVKRIILPDGEQYKSIAYLERIITGLLENKFNRNCCLVALGGGVIGDITGFAAACYQRGIDFIQVPTTLLAQVDASVGGKTAVNHPLGKNMIGAFHQPVAVIADTSVLKSLPEREFVAGMAEIIKYGLIKDRKFLDWLDDNIETLLNRDHDALAYAIECSCANKVQIVEKDEREAGLRAILNFGHTFGHAIETALEYKHWLHGEAVACGMLIAAELSRASGWLTMQDVDRIRRMLERTGLPVRLPSGVTAERLLELMAVDKKTKDGKIHLILLKRIGEAIVTPNYDQTKLVRIMGNFSVC